MAKFDIDSKTLEQQLSRQLERKLKILRESTHGTPTAELKDGAEVPDPNPISIRVRDGRLSDFTAVRTFLDTHLSRAAEEAGMETIDEANDFDVDDDVPLPNTPFEIEADQHEEDSRIIRENHARSAQAQYRAKYVKRRPKASEIADPVTGEIPAKEPVLKEKQ